MEKIGIAVVGGGAAGLMAAGQAAARLKKSAGGVSVFEGAPRVGKKLLATGNGRCNLTNVRAAPSFYHGEPEQAEPLLRVISPAQVTDVFEEMGLFCREEEEGRVYPRSGQAASVLDALRLFLQRNGGSERCGAAISGIKRVPGGFLLRAAEGNEIHARRVILAQGGKASPQISSDGGIPLAEMLGHSVTPLFPALVPVRTNPELVRALKGVRSRGTAELLADGRPVKREEGEVQFTDRGLSGICVFQLSRAASEFFSRGTVCGRRCRKLEISLDLLPDFDCGKVLELLERLALLYPELPARELPFGLMNKRAGQEAVKRALLQDPGRKAEGFSREQLRAVAQTMKSYVFPVTGVLPWRDAQVTAGGVPLSQIVLPKMESRVCPGAYLAGEMLNLDGDCGGFNLHWAWISGIAAGRSAAESLLQEE